MIQNLLIFLSGFLSAALLALLFLPAVWNRAVGLTRRGIEAAMPTTLEEITAKGDQLRARHAMELRRVEIERDEAARKAATLQVEASRSRQNLAKAAMEQDALKERAARLEKDMPAREAAVVELQARLKGALSDLAAQKEELGRIGGLYEEAALASSAHQMRIMERDDQISRLKQAMAKARAVAGPRGKDQPADAPRLAELEQQNLTLMAELARLRQEALRGDRDQSAGDRQLRETMLRLAADVVRVAAEQPDQAEPIARALAAPAPELARPTPDNVVSLADRIRRN